jgi:hypothetical protein
MIHGRKTEGRIVKECSSYAAPGCMRLEEAIGAADMAKGENLLTAVDTVDTAKSKENPVIPSPRHPHHPVTPSSSPPLVIPAKAGIQGVPSGA